MVDFENTIQEMNESTLSSLLPMKKGLIGLTKFKIFSESVGMPHISFVAVGFSVL